MALSASNAIQFEELPDRATLEQPARSLGHFSQWFKQGWDDIWMYHVTPTEKVTEEKSKGSPYSQDAMWWETEQPSVGESYFTKTFDEPNDFDQDAYDRVILLAKKYASERVGLNKEDHARLEMLNSTMDLKYPRYTEGDFRVLDEAEELLEEIEKIRGQ